VRDIKRIVFVSRLCPLHSAAPRPGVQHVAAARRSISGVPERRAPRLPTRRRNWIDNIGVTPAACANFSASKHRGWTRAPAPAEAKFLPPWLVDQVGAASNGGRASAAGGPLRPFRADSRSAPEPLQSSRYDTQGGRSWVGRRTRKLLVAVGGWSVPTRPLARVEAELVEVEPGLMASSAELRRSLRLAARPASRAWPAALLHAFPAAQRRRQHLQNVVGRGGTIPTAAPAAPASTSSRRTAPRPPDIRSSEPTPRVLFCSRRPPSKGFRARGRLEERPLRALPGQHLVVCVLPERSRADSGPLPGCARWPHRLGLVGPLLRRPSWPGHQVATLRPPCSGIS